MSAPSRHHLDLLVRRATSTAEGSSPLFKISQPDGNWLTVSYFEFLSDVRAVAAQVKSDIEAREGVVGIWLGGFSYTDFIHIIGVSYAGLTPQLFSLSLTHPDVVYGLLKQTRAVALIHDQSYSSAVANCPVPTLAAYELRSLKSVAEVKLPDSLPLVAFIYHTSGSTSGSPKLVPLTQNWLQSQNDKFRESWAPGSEYGTPDVFNQLGSICHSATMFEYLSILFHGGCIVLPSSLYLDTRGLQDMVQNCGLNRFVQFSPIHAKFLRAAAKDEASISLLRGLRSIAYGGAPLPPELEDWAHEQRLPIINIYASTECGVLMSSKIGEHPSHLRLLSIVVSAFEEAGSADVGSEGSEDSTSQQLYNLVLPPSSPDAPDPSLRDSDDILRTGDLFQPVPNSEGAYIWRGRDDDWIKDETTKRCDTKSIEDKVRETCVDIVSDCVVVGNLRPCPVLLVELIPSSVATKGDSARKAIIERLADFNKSRYKHEQIADERLIIIVPSGSLPRTATKGNIRRRAVEELYAKDLDRVYNMVAA